MTRVLRGAPLSGVVMVGLACRTEQPTAPSGVEHPEHYESAETVGRERRKMGAHLAASGRSASTPKTECSNPRRVSSSAENVNSPSFSCQGGDLSVRKRGSGRPEPEYDSHSACRRPRRPHLVLSPRPGTCRDAVLADERSYVHGQYWHRRLPRHCVGSAGSDCDFRRLGRRDRHSSGTGAVLRGADPRAAAGGLELHHPVSRSRMRAGGT
jgi:hypothetical protein